MRTFILQFTYKYIYIRTCIYIYTHTNMIFRIWDMHTRMEAMAPLQGHSSWVFCVVWSPDGTRLVSASDDKTLRVWDAGKFL
jgi:WD40 repeat protein